MKKAITLALSLALVTPAYANEIPGTRVQGEGAVCAEGQGKAIEMNLGTKETWSYCKELTTFLLPMTLPKQTVSPSPTDTPTPTPTPTTTEKPTSTTTTTTTEAVPVVSEPTSETSTAKTESTTTESEPTLIRTPTPTVTPTPPPTLPAIPEKSNVIIVDVSAQTETVREETETEYLNRWLFIWADWFNELLAWFASLG